VDYSSLTRYPLPSPGEPADSRRDIDWGLLLSRLVLRGLVVLSVGLMLFVLAVAATAGQILRLTELFG
jgi:hypothetical protein